MTRLFLALILISTIFASKNLSASIIKQDRLVQIRTALSQPQSSAKKAWEHIHAVSWHLLDEPIVERKLEGRRMLSASREVFKRVAYLGYTARVLGRPMGDEFAQRAIEEMLASAEFSDWNPSHFLDTAEMTTALGLGLDILGPWLTPDQAMTISQAIVKKGLRPGLDEPDPWWARAPNNWNQVSNAGLAIGALAVAELDPELADRIIKRALNNLPMALETYAPDGVYPEGPMYWAYGTNFTILFIEAMRASGRLPSNWLEDHAAFKASPWFMLHATGPTGQFFNFGDSNKHARLLPAMFWFAREFSAPELLVGQLSQLQALEQNADYDPIAQASRFLPFLLDWSAGLDAKGRPEANSWFGYGKKSVALMRTGWGASDCFLGIVGGTGSVSHGQLDAGGFVYETQGHRWIVDLGAPAYEPLERAGLDIWNRAQDSDRWQVFHFSNYSHNTLTVNRRIHSVQARASLIEAEHFTQNSGASAHFDLTPVYQNQLSSARRATSLLPNGDAFIRDTIQALPDLASSVSWRVLVEAEVEIDDHGRSARLFHGDRTLTLILQEPRDAYIREIELQPGPYLERPKGVRQLEIVLNLQPGERREIHVALTSQHESAVENLQWVPSP